MNEWASFIFIHQFMNRIDYRQVPLVTTRGINSSIHVPRVGYHPTRGTWQDLMPHVASNLKFMCHAWDKPPRGTGHFTAWFSYHTRSNATRSAPRPAHVPHVACTPHAPPPTVAHVPRVASHRTRRPLAVHVPHVTWHARRTRRPCRRTCHVWLLTARAAPRLAYVPRVASRRTRRPCATRDTRWR